MYKDKELGLVIQFWHFETTFFRNRPQGTKIGNFFGNEIKEE